MGGPLLGTVAQICFMNLPLSNMGIFVLFRNDPDNYLMCVDCAVCTVGVVYLESTVQSKLRHVAV